MFCRIMGYDEVEIRKLTFKDLTHPDDLENDIKNVHKLMNKELAVYKTEKRYIRKDGQVVWGSLTVTSTYDSDGQFLYNLGIIEDITERKLASEALQETGIRLDLALNSSHSGVWDWDVATNKIIWSEQMYELFGTDMKVADASFDTWRAALHPDDKEQAELKIAEALKNKINLQNNYRVRLPDGKIRWINATGKAFYDTNGQPLRMIGICNDITEQKIADEKIREKDIEFRKLSANVPDLIFQFTRRPDGTYYVPIASEGIRNIFGCTPEDVVADFSPIGRVIYKDDVERVIHDIEYSAEHLTYFTCEFRVQIPGREIQWIYSNSTPERLPDGSVTWYGFNMDITSKKLAEEALREKSSRLDLAMQTANMAWWEMEISTGKVTFDKLKATMLGYQPEKFKHYTDFTALIHPEDLDKAMNAMKMHLSRLSEKYEVEYRIMNSAGEYKWFYDIGAIVKNDDNGAPLNVIGFVIDINARKNAEEEIIKLNETLEQRVEDRTVQLKEANHEMEAFSYSVSHDLRAPLRHVIGFSEKLESELRDKNDPEITRLTGKIKNAASRMSLLIDELLTYSRHGRAELKAVKLSLNAIIKNIIKEAADITKGRKIEWKISQFPDVIADSTLIKLVLQNLILNSIKFTSKKKNAVIEIGFYDKSKKEYTIFVKDNGAGFNNQYVDKLFGVFQRLHTNEEFEGTGIGLATVRRIIHKHNGSVWAEGVENEGATFFFTLPKRL
ncbi:MAG: PAS domain-containing protein [Bacteroidales bacterium]|nr:PAS domain-containing protein [Bacteroidales bacterium]